MSLRHDVLHGFARAEVLQTLVVQGQQRAVRALDLNGFVEEERQTKKERIMVGGGGGRQPAPRTTRGLCCKR